MRKNKVNIVPATKVSDLLRDYPELEETLMHYSAAFAALKNPVLRRTVARVTSLQQAAKVGNVDVVEMVNALRSAAGLGSLEDGDGAEAALSVPVVTQAPEVVTFVLDVRPIIDEGGHPKDEVYARADELQLGECMELLAPFPPIPLLEGLNKRGFKTSMLEASDGVVRSFVMRI